MPNKNVALTLSTSPRACSIMLRCKVASQNYDKNSVISFYC